MEKENKKRIGCLIVAVVVIVGLGVFFFGGEKASWYSEEQHAQRIAKRIEKNYMTEKYDYTSFEVYPLYTQEEKLGYFLVEFEPSGFMYVKVREQNRFYLQAFGGARGLYGKAHGDLEWSRYRLIDPMGSPTLIKNMEWFERDENDEKIVYNRSPYIIVGVENERMYIIKDTKKGGSYIPAVKKDNEFLNLISLMTFDFENGELIEAQASMPVRYVHKRAWDLV